MRVDITRVILKDRNGFEKITEGPFEEEYRPVIYTPVYKRLKTIPKEELLSPLVSEKKEFVIKNRYLIEVLEYEEQ